MTHVCFQSQTPWRWATAPGGVIDHFLWLLSGLSTACHWAWKFSGNHWGYHGIPNGWVVTLRCYQTWLEKKHAKHFIFWCPFSSWISQTAMELMKSIEIRWYQVWPMLRLQHFDMGLPKIGGNPIPSHGEFPHFSHIFPWSSSFSDSCTAHIVSRSSKPMSTSAKEVCISGLNVEAGSSRMKILWTIINQHISLNYIYNYIYNYI